LSDGKYIALFKISGKLMALSRISGDVTCCFSMPKSLPNVLGIQDPHSDISKSKRSAVYNVIGCQDRDDVHANLCRIIVRSHCPSSFGQ
jgi:hypothetical protein